MFYHKVDMEKKDLWKNKAYFYSWTGITSYGTTNHNGTALFRNHLQGNGTCVPKLKFFGQIVLDTVGEEHAILTDTKIVL